MHPHHTCLRYSPCMTADQQVPGTSSLDTTHSPLGQCVLDTCHQHMQCTPPGRSRPGTGQRCTLCMRCSPSPGQQGRNHTYQLRSRCIRSSAKRAGTSQLDTPCTLLAPVHLGTGLQGNRRNSLQPAQIATSLSSKAHMPKLLTIVPLTRSRAYQPSTSSTAAGPSRSATSRWDIPCTHHYPAPDPRPAPSPTKTRTSLPRTKCTTRSPPRPDTSPSRMPRS